MTKTTTKSNTSKSNTASDRQINDELQKDMAALTATNKILLDENVALRQINDELQKGVNNMNRTIRGLRAHVERNAQAVKDALKMKEESKNGK